MGGLGIAQSQILLYQFEDPAAGVGHAASGTVGGLPLYDDRPQYGAGCALKMPGPLINRIVSATTLIQCLIRTASACRR